MLFLISIIIFLFTLFVLSKDDFVFLRRNVTTRDIFNLAFIVGVTGLFFARLVFVAQSPSISFLNPFVFFIIPYFPGLSSSGFLMGSIIAIYIVGVRKKYPLGRIYDIFSLSFVSSSSLFFASSAVVEFLHRKFMTGLEVVIIAVIFLLQFLFLKRFSQKLSWKDGSIAFINISFVGIILVIYQFLINGIKKFPSELPYFGLLFFLLILSVIVKNFVKKKNE